MKKRYTGNISFLPVNSANRNFRQLASSAMSGGYDFADTLHNIYLDYGYPQELVFLNFWNMYRRFGVAQKAIGIYPEQTWRDSPIVVGNPAFNKGLEILVGRGLWRRLEGLDVRQRVGRYGGMFMRVRDGQKPDTPLTKRFNGLSALVDFIPLYESQIEAVFFEDDPTKDDFDSPTMYQFSSGGVGDRNSSSSSTFNIHPDRIVIAAEDADNGSIYGIPVLESVYNDLMDLRKILGGGGEGFYKNAAQSIVFNLKDASSASANKPLLDKFNENYDEFSQDRMRRAMWTPGMDATVLESNLMNPKEFAENSLFSISAGVSVPMSMLIGNQTGRLAGDQDTKGFLSQVQSRRLNFATDMVKAQIDWLLKWGILASSEYTIEWPDAHSPSSEEKLGNAKVMSEINKMQFESGNSRPFSSDEIREASGFASEESEEIPDETLEDDEADFSVGE